MSEGREGKGEMERWRGLGGTKEYREVVVVGDSEGFASARAVAAAPPCAGLRGGEPWLGVAPSST